MVEIMMGSKIEPILRTIFFSIIFPIQIYTQGVLMSDFITLTCPSCGGELKISQDTLSLRCKFCGAEHMLKREAGSIFIEAFARCPICQRNDKAQKISAITASNTHGLAEMFQPPVKPKYEEGLAPNSTAPLLGSLISSITIVIIFVCWGGQLISGVAALITNFLLVVFDILCIRNIRKLNREYRSEEEKAREEFKNEIQEWKKKKRRWNSLYYCFRDDCVYVPGEPGHSTSKKFKDFLG